jgi:protein-tyrosine kinase
MSRLHRAVEKAEREGLLTWTRPLENHSREATALEEPAAESVRYDTPPASFDITSDTATRSFTPPSGIQLEPGGTTTVTPDWTTSSIGDDEPIFPDTAFSPLFVAATEPGSPAAEQYRLLRTRLETRDATRRTQLLLVTSPRLGDGKTTTSANLALTMAREFQHKVVLVEADLRRPSLASRFGIQAERGLVDVLVGALPLEEAFVRVPGHQLALLPAGAEAARSTELLASTMMQRVLEALRARFDRIVVDTPPAGLADTHVLARLADGILVVVRAGVTPRPALERALASIDRERLLGIVLNEVDDAPGEYSYPGLEYSGGRRE